MRTLSIFSREIYGNAISIFYWHNNTIVDNKYTYKNEIMNKIRDLLSHYTQKHSKALIFRFDIHYPQDYVTDLQQPILPISNADISTCMAYVIKKYKRQGLDPYYIWVREQHKSLHPHYHCALLLDGQKIRSYSHVFDTVQDEWERVIECPASGCINHCICDTDKDYNGKIIRRSDKDFLYTQRCQEVFQQLSYLAKTHTKAQNNDGLRNFGISRIPKLTLQGIFHE